MKYMVSLTDRNKEVYNKIESKFQDSNHCAVVQATGTGKSYLAMELICRNDSKDILYLAPTNAILKQLKVSMAKEGLLGNVNIDNMDEIDYAISIRFPHLQLHTYHWFHIHQTSSSNDLDNKNYDYLICDEYHHTGGDKWYLSFNEFQTKHPETKYLGMSATPQRFDGQSTLFSFDNDVVSEYSLAEAIADGVLPIPKYIDVGVRFLDKIEESLETIISEFPEGKEKEELINKIKSFIRKINEYDKLPEVIEEYVPENGKVLYFCPPSNNQNRVNNTKEIYEIYKLKNNMFDGLDPNAHYYMSFSEHANSELEEEIFLSDNYEGLKVLYTVNKYNEGVHAENINCLIMGRGTSSVSLFYQQLGRALSAGRNLEIEPIVLDLVGNIHIYQELVEEVRKVAIQRVSSGKRLPGNKTVEEFVSGFTIKDCELEQKEFLDYLTENIRDNRDKNQTQIIIDYVEGIEAYCERFKEWPVRGKDKRVSADSKTSNQLAYWLIYTSGYINGNFKYEDVVDEKGILIKDRLDNLFEKYGKVSRYSDESKTEWVKEIEVYCEKFQEWPVSRRDKRVSADSKTSNQLARWLTQSGYSLNQFKYGHIVDENGISIKERLDILANKYGYISERNDKSKIKYVEEIEAYCEKFHEWPKTDSDQKVTENSKTSNQLASWLRRTSGYNDGEFKYSNIVDENGISLKERLDNLFQIYGKVSWSSDLYVIEMVEEIENYCKHFGELPAGDEERRVSANSKTNKVLRKWLYNSGYYNNKFKYTAVVDDNGVSVQDKLDNLFQIYGTIDTKYSTNKDGYLIAMVGEVEAYCEKFHEWPNVKSDNKVPGKEKTGQQLANWLSNSGYNVDDFKYIDVIDENGVSLKTRLDKYSKQYKKQNIKSDEHVLDIVNEIEVHCKFFKEWPQRGKFETNIAPGNSRNSKQLATWVNEGSRYISGNFKYEDIKDENGVSLKTRLDKYSKQYKKQNIKSDEHVLDIVNEIEVHCKFFKEWPQRGKFETNIAPGNSRNSKQLATWVNEGSRYISGNFKYEDIKDENGIPIKDRLDNLFAIYAGAKRQDKLNDNNTVNLWAAKDSDNLGISLYYMVIQLKNSFDNDDKDMFNYYKELISSKVTNNFIDLDINSLIGSFSLSKEERMAYYYMNYGNYSIQNNNDLAIFYRNLYDYEKAFTIDEDKKIK